MAKTCRAGCAEVRKLMKRYPGYSLLSSRKGGHLTMVDPKGKIVRLPDGRKLTVVSSPQNQSMEARALTRALASVGITPTA